jgi:hypothetical protein
MRWTASPSRGTFISILPSTIRSMRPRRKVPSFSVAVSAASRAGNSSKAMAGRMEADLAIPR